MTEDQTRKELQNYQSTARGIAIVVLMLSRAVEAVVYTYFLGGGTVYLDYSSLLVWTLPGIFWGFSLGDAAGRAIHDYKSGDPVKAKSTLRYAGGFAAVTQLIFFLLLVGIVFLFRGWFETVILWMLLGRLALNTCLQAALLLYVLGSVGAGKAVQVTEKHRI